MVATTKQPELKLTFCSRLVLSAPTSIFSYRQWLYIQRSSAWLCAGLFARSADVLGDLVARLGALGA
jgi:hypothetical protein